MIKVISSALKSLQGKTSDDYKKESLKLTKVKDTVSSIRLRDTQKA